MAEEKTPKDIAADQVEKKRERRFRLILLVVGAVLGAGLAYGISLWSNRLRTMRYYVSASPSLFPKPEQVREEIKISLKDKTISNLTSVTILVVNADVDLTDVPIHIRFAPIDGQKAPMIHVRPKLPKEAFTHEDKSGTEGNTLLESFTLHVFNRNDYVEFECLFEGEKAPDISVNTVIKGVKLESRPWQTKEPKTWADILIPLSIAVGVLGTMVAIGNYFGKEQQRKRFTTTLFRPAAGTATYRIIQDGTGEVIGIEPL